MKKEVESVWRIMNRIEDTIDFDDGFSVRTCNVLMNAGITYWSELEAKTDKEILMLKNAGRKSLNEIKYVLSSRRDSLPKLTKQHTILVERACDEAWEKNWG